MYWTDWGSPAKVERASMDGRDRTVLIDTDIVSPYGITIDYAEQRIYWVDAELDKIEYSNTDGSGRVTLTTLPPGTGLGTPYSLTLEGDYLYWTEWDENALYSVHKTEGGYVMQIVSDLFVNPNGIQTVSASRRQYGEICYIAYYCHALQTKILNFNILPPSPRPPSLPPSLPSPTRCKSLQLKRLYPPLSVEQCRQQWLFLQLSSWHGAGQ